MRLEKIKLSGFKSFVDPTTVNFPSNLVGIVGPNGCGKSNVIDAVRWVMGESSAKYLRGESIADVIFNGSNTRKPLGKASVEMIFDNSDGQVGGQFANYSQIAIRREIDRDAQSSYFLNGTRCRRKDITNVFLGTGLGPRSYAIIEQGMINRIIESKPQDLRGNFEEVAGISKYKERRRETENRIKHTKENLSRINDLYEEIEKQVERLQRQSRAAEKYKELKEEERELKAQLLALKSKNLTEAIEKHDALLADGELLLEAKVTELQRVDTEIVKLREAQHELHANQSDLQDQNYKLGTEITRHEQNIQHHKSRHDELSSDLEQIQQTLGDSKTHLENDRWQIDELTQELAELEPQLEQVKARSNDSSENFSVAEEALQNWQIRWESFNEQSSKASKTVEVERTRIQHIEQQRGDANHRLQKLTEERSSIDYSELQSTHQSLQEKIESAQETVQSHESTLRERQDQLREQRSQNQQQVQRLDELRQSLQQHRGRMASLEALQQAALGQTGAATKWLEQHELSQQPRLAQQLDVDSGWERAVEAVLGNYLEAVCIDGIDRLKADLLSLSEGQLTFLESHPASAVQAGNKAPLLKDKIRSDSAVNDLLGHVYAVDNLPAALQLRGQLDAHESIVTRDGIWLGRQWLRVVRLQDSEQGVIQREQELRELNETISLEEQQLVAEEATLREGEARLAELESSIEQVQQDLSQHNTVLADLRADLRVHQERLQKLQARAAELDQECDALSTQTETSQTDLHAAQENLRSAMEIMQTDASERERMLAERDERRAKFNEARDQAQTDRDELHRLDIRVQTAQSQLQSLQQACERLEQQSSSLKQRQEAIQAELELGDNPVEEIKEKLQGLLSMRSELDEKIQSVKQALSEVDYQMRQQEDARKSLEGAIQEVRESLEHKRLEVQEQKVRRTTLSEQLAELECELEAILEHLPDEAEEKAWDERLQQTTNRIARLGPINLAAIEELKTETERKEYLSTQRADLEEAMTTLENAIKKIDQETRTRFREVFDKVNEEFQQLFPKIFGGGKAYLELTDDNLLEAGVLVMARPPGKKNSTIHLLSGGEKALTAIALIFSMFRMNPAPFCMLDEVDAPLDDANVLRYSNLVKEMSKTLQFIFITHNKITMEIAEQLTGVTMNEPGASRIVAVDVEQATALAEA